MGRDPVQLTAAERAALDALVPSDQQTGDARADLLAAIAETWRRREENTRLGAAVIAALHRDAGSWRTVEYLTGIPRMTARRWAVPPEKAQQPPTEPTVPPYEPLRRDPE
jgi:hypothetical protein